MKKLQTLLLILTAIILTSCQPKEVTLSNRSFALDTVIEIKLYYGNKKTADEKLIDEAFNLIDDLEDILSVHIEGSELYNIKENAGITPVEVSDITYNIIKESIKYSKVTDGLFDVTAGPLIDLWAIDPPDGYVPTDKELEEVLKLIDYNKIEFLEDNKIYLQEENMIINLGAIAKGAIADEAKDYLMENGVTSAYLNLGGNVLLIGSKLDDSDFAIGIQNPFDDQGVYIMAVDANDVAVVTSGDYERCFVYEGKEYHHILNTETGYPAETNIKQVTIIAPTSQAADALSTSILLLGIEDGVNLINSIEGAEAIFITKDKKIFATDALRDKITYVEEQMSDFAVTEDASELYD